MGVRARLALVALSASLLLAAATAICSADKLRFSSQPFTWVWPSLEFRTGSTSIVRCPVTMEGRAHSATIVKVNNALVGYINRATAASASCTGGSVTVREETLPWHVKYTGFSGVLPRIEGIGTRVQNERFWIFTAGMRCSLETTEANPATYNLHVEARGAVTGVTPNESAEIPLGGEGFCSVFGNEAEGGEGQMTVPGSSTKETVTLI